MPSASISTVYVAAAVLKAVTVVPEPTQPCEANTVLALLSSIATSRQF
jgi:hypothetical protein